MISVIITQFLGSISKVHLGNDASQLIDLVLNSSGGTWPLVGNNWWPESAKGPSYSGDDQAQMRQSNFFPNREEAWRGGGQKLMDPDTAKPGYIDGGLGSLGPGRGSSLSNYFNVPLSGIGETLVSF